MKKPASLPLAALISGLLVLSTVQAQTQNPPTPQNPPTQTPQTQTQPAPNRTSPMAQPTDARTTKDRINADYKMAKAACDRLAGNAKDICVEEAKGREKVALAELEYGRTGKVEDMVKVELAKADAAYEVAKERCDDKGGNERDVCMKEAKAAEVRAKADARARGASNEARGDAASDKRDADYKLAVERCDSLAGDAKRSCVDSAKSRYGKD